MKKLFVFAALTSLLVGCNKENIVINETPDLSHPILQIGLSSLKTALGTEAAGVFPVVWSEGDEIAVIDKMGVEGQQNVSVFA